jgi:hypothetical protein
VCAEKGRGERVLECGADKEGERGAVGPMRLGILQEDGEWAYVLVKESIGLWIFVHERSDLGRRKGLWRRHA